MVGLYIGGPASAVPRDRVTIYSTAKAAFFMAKLIHLIHSLRAS